MKKSARQIVEQLLAEPQRIRLFEWVKKARKEPTYANVQLTAKMWLLPDGRLQSLNGELHDTWLQANPEVAKRFGMNPAELRRDHQGVRMAALRKGFIRVAYERGNGRLAIEGLFKFLVGQAKSTLFMLIADNINAIDVVTVNLFNDKGGIVVSQTANLFSYDDKEKLDHIPVISETLRYRVIARKYFS